MSDNSIDVSFDKSIFERVLIAWRSREFSHKSLNLIKILAVSIYYDKLIYKEELDRSLEILKKHIKQEEIVELFMDKIKLKLNSYIKDYRNYLADRDLVFKIVANDIELYGIMVEVFESDGDVNELESSSKYEVTKEYEKKWS